MLAGDLPASKFGTLLAMLAAGILADEVATGIFADEAVTGILIADAVVLALILAAVDIVVGVADNTLSSASNPKSNSSSCKKLGGDG